MLYAIPLKILYIFLDKKYKYTIIRRNNDGLNNLVCGVKYG